MSRASSSSDVSSEDDDADLPNDPADEDLCNGIAVSKKDGRRRGGAG
jgi:hypothetical protein